MSNNVIVLYLAQYAKYRAITFDFIIRHLFPWLFKLILAINDGDKVRSNSNDDDRAIITTPLIVSNPPHLILPSSWCDAATSVSFVNPPFIMNSPPDLTRFRLCM